MLAVGTAASCLIHPPEVFRAANALGAHPMIVAHNHPSSNVATSLEDIQLTERLVDSGALLGKPELDSLVIAASGLTGR